jgi:hypothetical protein
MSGGAPIPIVSNKDESSKEARILSIADLEEEGSKKLPRVVQGERCDFFNIIDYRYSSWNTISIEHLMNETLYSSEVIQKLVVL